MTIAGTSSVSIGSTSWWISIVMFVFWGVYHRATPMYWFIMALSFRHLLGVANHLLSLQYNMIAKAAVAAAKNVRLSKLWLKAPESPIKGKEKQTKNHQPQKKRATRSGSFLEQKKSRKIEKVESTAGIKNVCHQATSKSFGMKSVAGVVALGSVKAKCSERVPRNSSTRMFPPGFGWYRHHSES